MKGKIEALVNFIARCVTSTQHTSTTLPDTLTDMTNIRASQCSVLFVKEACLQNQSLTDMYGPSMRKEHFAYIVMSSFQHKEGLMNIFMRSWVVDTSVSNAINHFLVRLDTSGIWISMARPQCKV